MSGMKPCRGCFAEMDEEDEKCYKCGWRIGNTFPREHRFQMGEVLQKRYLVGNLYYVSEEKDITVYYFYDNLLSIPCMALIRSKKEEKDYIEIARRMEASKKGREGKLVILGLKKLKDTYVLLFSMENRYMATEVFEGCLEYEAKEKTTDKGEAVTISGLKQILPMGTILDERYQIRDCLGIGGFGITYLCRDLTLQREVAVKEYFPDKWAERDDNFVAVRQSKLLRAYQFGMRSFLKEITIAAKFIHTPHMVSVYDAFAENDSIYLVMEYVDGISIGKLMKESGYRPMELPEMAKIMLPVLDVLEAMHDRQIVHSDISPGNIMYAGEGQVYLIDMGAAKYMAEREPTLSAIFLKLEYAAPEQYRTAVEHKPAGEGPWTDIYALGATMYYMLTGQKPTDVINRMNGTDEKLTQSLEGKLPEEWIVFLQEVMALDKEKRIRSIPELRKRMKKLLK